MSNDVDVYYGTVCAQNHWQISTAIVYSVRYTVEGIQEPWVGLHYGALGIMVKNLDCIFQRDVSSR